MEKSRLDVLTQGEIINKGSAVEEVQVEGSKIGAREVIN